MNNCSIIDKQTKEPKVVYKPDNGTYTTDYVQALQNSANNIEVGYMQNNNFTKVATLPKLGLDTNGGVIQHFIENGLLKPTQKEKDTYEAVDEISAELIEEFYIKNKNGHAYTRVGKDFILPATETVEQEMEVDAHNLSLKKLKTKYGAYGVRMYASNLLTNFLNKSKKKDVKFTEETLKNKIEVFMKQMGISSMSIDEYKKRYELKHGVAPDAKALININERVIAFLDGKIELSELSEEISHFIIEGLNQSEVEAILPYVEQTTYYEKFADLYREVYYKQLGEEQGEKYVRKEILGKMLADFLQKDFNIESKNEIEKNIFQKLGDLLSNFINFVKGKATTSMKSQIETMFEDIQNRLYNENLNEELDYAIDVGIQEMYSLGDSKEIRDLVDVIRKIGANRVIDKKVFAEFDSFDDVDGFLNGLNAVLNETDKRVRINMSSISKANGNGDLIDPSTNADANTILTIRPNLNYVLGVIANSPTIPTAIKSAVSNVGTSINNNMNSLDLALKYNESLQDVSIEDYLRSIGETETNIEAVMEEVGKTRGDLKWWFKQMGNISKSSNPLVVLYSKIVYRVFNKAHLKTQAVIDKYVRPLLENYSVSEINSVAGEVYIKSEVDKDKLKKEEDEYEYKLRESLNLLGDDIKTFDDYVNSKDYNAMVSSENASYYKYIWQKKHDSVNQKWIKKEYKDRTKKELDKYAKLGVTDANHPLFKFLVNQSDLRRKYSKTEDSAREIGIANYREKKKQMNIFLEDGSVKPNITFDKVSNLKGDFIELNNKKGWGIQFKNDQSLTNDIVYQDSLLTYSLIKWNQEFESIDDSTKNTIKQNYEKAWNLKLKEVQNLPQKEKVKELLKWITSNTQFTMSDAYWEKMGKEISGIQLLLTKSLSRADRTAVEEVERKVTEYSMMRKVILDSTKDPSDSKEIDATVLTENLKDDIKKIEDGIQDEMKKISAIFTNNNVDMYGGSDSVVSANKAFKREFSLAMGVEYDSATAQQAEKFFTKVASSKKVSGLEKVKEALKSGKTSPMIKDLKSKIGNNSATNDEIIKAYMTNNLPIYYKRYDTDIAYDKMMQDFRVGNVTESQLIDFVNTNLRDGSVSYKGVKIKDMEFSPNFKFASEIEERSSDIFKEYLEVKDNYTSERERYEHLKRVLKIDKYDSSYKADLSEFLNDNRKLKLYNDILEMKMMLMYESNTLDKFDILLKPQYRRSNINKSINFFKRGDKKEQIKEYIDNFTNFRGDENADAYITNTIPLYGYRRVAKADLSDDFLSNMMMFANDSNLYNSRREHFKISNTIIREVANSTYGNKSGVESEYYDALKKLQQIHFFGRRLTAEARVSILGKEVDVAKMAVAVKNIALNVSLGLSPIVALTNATTGKSVIQTMKWSGDVIYSPSHDRALSNYGSIITGGVSEIGNMLANNKLNRIGESFGVFKGLDRLMDSKYSKTARLANKSLFSLMEITNYPIVGEIMMSKLMEFRVIDGKVFSWANYKYYNSINHPKKTHAEIKAEFENAKDKSLWDAIGENGALSEQKLKEFGAVDSLENIQLDAMAKLQDVIEEATGQLGDATNTLGAYNPWMQFVLSLKKWMVLATTNVFSEQRFDQYRGTNVRGLYLSPKDLFKLVKEAKQNNLDIAKAWDSLSPEERMNLKTASVTTGLLIGLLVLASLVVGYADDDDNKDSYMAQMAAYMVKRTLNEASSATYGLPNSYYEALQQPVQTLGIVKDATNLLSIGDVNDTLQTGKFKGWNKYVANALKLTPLKNLQTVSSTYAVRTSSEGYSHFGTQNSMYNILSWIPENSDEEED